MTEHVSGIKRATRYGVRHLGSLTVVALIVLGALLRSCGLSHDLDEGRVYHPDTAKQIAATQRFLEGRYYQYVGNPDYDGYPALNSHSVEWLARPMRWVYRMGRNHLGLRAGPDFPDTAALFWLTRLWNVLVATLAVYVTYRLGRQHFGALTGLLAAALLALSPLDVLTCHDAMSDTLAAFLATVALYFALRMAHEGRYRDYIGAALCAMAAFSAKYNAAVAFVPCAIAHLAHEGVPGGFYRPRSLKRAGVFLVAMAIGFVVSTPAFWVAPRATLTAIGGFMRYTSSFGMNAELLALSPWRRFLYAMTHNYPTFLMILGPVVFLLVLVWIPIEGLRRRKGLVILAGPLFYVLAGLPFKPHAQPAHHLVIMPALFLMAARTLTLTATAPRRRRPLLLPIAVILAVLAMGHLALRTHAELFFLRCDDTQLLFQKWLNEHVPMAFRVGTPDYFLAVLTGKGHDSGLPPDDQGNLLFQTPATHYPTPGAPGLRQDFILGTRAFSEFHNQPIIANIISPKHLRKGWHRPSFQHTPSREQPNVIFDTTRAFGRGGKCFEVAPGYPVNAHLASHGALPHTVIGLRTGGQPATLRLSIGGHRYRIQMDAFNRRTIALPPLKPVPLAFSTQRFHRIALRATGGRAVVTLATTPEERGALLFGMEAYAAALPDLRIAAREGNPALHAMAELARRLTNPAERPPLPGSRERLDALAQSVESPARMFDHFGLSEAYMHMLPYMTFARAQLIVQGIDPSALATPEMLLEPGGYLAEVGLSNHARTFVGDGAFSVTAHDTQTGQVLAREVFRMGSLTHGGFGERTAVFRFTVPTPTVACSLTTKVPIPEEVVVISVAIRPDPLESLRYLKTRLSEASAH